MSHKFNYKWKFEDYPKDKNGLKVFSCFACGGGSSMGYKLAGYDVIGCNEIDAKMMEIYETNHNPQFPFLSAIQSFKREHNLPKELFDLDILDGSPPCSTFSMAGQREKNWGKAKKFREGQAEQILDDLFFDFIDLADKLRPKVIVGENVKGMIAGNAKGYIKLIQQKLDKIGYNIQLFLLNSATMGVPQKRERVFFICSRKDLNLPKLKLDFNEEPISFKEATNDLTNTNTEVLSPLFLNYWKKAKYGESVGTWKASKKINPFKPLQTILSGTDIFHYDKPRKISKEELIVCSSFPSDYNFLNNKPQYVMGMSVPPIMIAQISKQIQEQWLNPTNPTK